MSSIKDKTIFITGATAGFGHAMAVRFAELGAKIVATGRREDRLNELKKRLGDKVVHTLTADMRDYKALKYAIGKIPGAFNDIEILVNNAGLALGFAKVPDTELSDWEQMVDTNIKGVLYCTELLVPHMISRGRGHIVNIGSVAGSYAYPCGNVYGATKAFIKQFSQNLRSDLLGKHIRVTNIEPGMAETEFSLVRFHGAHDKARDVYKDTTPLTAHDIAEAVLFCLTQPPHVNVTSLEIMPTQQALAGFAIHRAG